MHHPDANRAAETKSHVLDSSVEAGQMERLLEMLRRFGSPGWIRTSDHPINSRMLYR
jgi:hypothetical protein